MKFITIVCILVSFFSLQSLANENVQNRNGIFYDIVKKKNFTGIYTSKYIYKTLSGSGEIEWKYTYRYKIPMKNGLRNGTATLYKSMLAKYIDDDREYQRADSYKDIEVLFNNGKIVSVKQFSRDGALKSTTSFHKGVAERYDQETGKLTAKFGYIETEQPNPPGRKDKGYYLLMGEFYALDGEFFIYKSRDRTRMSTYEKNIKHGPFVSMHSKEQISQQGSYSHGEMDGDYKVYCKDGRLAKHQTYLIGEVVDTLVDNGDNYCYK